MVCSSQEDELKMKGSVGIRIKLMRSARVLLISVVMLSVMIMSVSASTTVVTGSKYKYRLFVEHTVITVPKTVSQTNEIVIKINQSATETNRIKYAESVNKILFVEEKIRNATSASDLSVLVTLILAYVGPLTSLSYDIAGMGYSLQVQQLSAELKLHINNANLYFNALYPYRIISPGPGCQFTGITWVCAFGIFE